MGVRKKTIELSANGIVAKFYSNVSTLTYKLVLQELAEGRNFEAIQLLLKHQLASKELSYLTEEDGFMDSALFAPALQDNFLNFVETHIDLEADTEEYNALCDKYGVKLAKITLGSEDVYIKPMTRGVFSKVFNMGGQSPLDAWDLIYSELGVEENKLDRTSIEYVSGFKVVNPLLAYRGGELKKK